MIILKRVLKALIILLMIPVRMLEALFRPIPSKRSLGETPKQAPSSTLLTDFLSQIRSDQTLTRAILVEGHRASEEARAEMESAVGKVRPRAEVPTLDDAIRSAISVVTGELMSKVMKRQGYEMAMPGFELPHGYPVLIAFGVFILTELCEKVREEGRSVDANINAAEWINSFLVLQNGDVKKEIYLESMRHFNGLVAATEDGVKGWRENMLQLLNFYCLELQHTKAPSGDIDLVEVFGSMLKSLMSAVEPRKELKNTMQG